MSDWLSSTLNLNTGSEDREYCPNCGEGDGDWCDECDGCKYRRCDTCTCTKVYEVTVAVRVEARSEEDIDDYMVFAAVNEDRHCLQWRVTDML